MKKWVFVLILTLITGCATTETTNVSESPEPIKEIKESPIKWESELSKIHDNYLPVENYGIRTGTVTHIVIHYMSNVFDKPHSPYEIEDIKALFTQNGVSSHYVIDRSGDVFRFVPEKRVAFHAGVGTVQGFPQYEDNLNQYSIGIELLAIGTREEMASIIPEDVYDTIDRSHIGYTPAQYEALQVLIEDISTRHPTVQMNRTHIIGHDEYAPGRKNDPGILFDWTQLGF
ncbi:N-acetylmuramoyl-L-alanine amidase [Alkalihalobacillus sp. LMS39]|uniref:N-acetylmuramoyl-L-alanine amidase n=1 Tax=Alkalihalobacillus sp. LMS39 TaxID=2924032 RepID=UPI001FB31B38|nr:N-acetylmuramoyl-L-alanine amidase [Alkalihalobacillus sp. LMS39]UOE96204.1 N-acetylmuramoyl-L-alanine amidase [Alkalihalobacillus sp. LMS39]